MSSTSLGIDALGSRDKDGRDGKRFKRIEEELDKLSGAVDEIARKEYSQPVEIGGEDDLGV